MKMMRKGRGRLAERELRKKSIRENREGVSEAVKRTYNSGARGYEDGFNESSSKFIQHSRDKSARIYRNMRKLGRSVGVEEWKQKGIRTSIKEGVSAIMNHHPAFSDIGNYLSKHVDKKKLYSIVENVYRELRRKNVPEHIRMDYLSEALSNYIAGGSVFDERGKKMLLKKGLEAKTQGGFFKGFFARRKLEGEAYVDNVVAAFSEMYKKMEKSAMHKHTC